MPRSLQPVSVPGPGRQGRPASRFRARALAPLTGRHALGADTAPSSDTEQCTSGGPPRPMMRVCRPSLCAPTPVTTRRLVDIGVQDQGPLQGSRRVHKARCVQRVLFEYNESCARRGAVSTHIRLAYIASFFTAGIVYLVLGVDALARSLGRLSEVSSAAPAVGGSAAAVGAAAVGYTLCRYRAEDGAFRLEMRRIRSGPL